MLGSCCRVWWQSFVGPWQSFVVWLSLFGSQGCLQWWGLRDMAWGLHSLPTSLSITISFLAAHSSFLGESISSHPGDSFMNSFIPPGLHSYHNFIHRGRHFILTWHLIHPLPAAPSFNISSLAAFISISSLFRLFISAGNLFHSLMGCVSLTP